MKKAATATLIVAALALGAVLLTYAPADRAYADAVAGEELSMYMDHMRRQTHKLGLAIDGKNKELAKFYVNEIQETTGIISEKFPEYDGVQVAQLAKAMLTPYTTPLATAIDGGDWAGASSGYDNLLTGGCNGCHTATQHAYIKIVRDKKNPYNQSFAP